MTLIFLHGPPGYNIHILNTQDTQHNRNVPIKQKPNRKKDQQHVVRIKIHDLLQYRMVFCTHHLSVVGGEVNLIVFDVL